MRIRVKDYTQGLRTAKSLGGTYDSVSKTWILPESAGADLMKMCGKSSLSAACAAYGMELVSSSNSGGSVCRVCGGRVNYAERYARPGYCGCEGE